MINNKYYQKKTKRESPTKNKNEKKKRLIANAPVIERDSC